MKELLVIISAAFIIELIVLLFKIKLFDPYRKKKEQNNNPGFMVLSNFSAYFE